MSTDNFKQSLRLRKWFWFAVIVAVTIAVAVLLWPYLALLTDREALREIILGSGPWAPLTYIFLQFLQVVVAPIPGTVIGLAGGFIFETLLATFYAMIGTTLGFLVVFIISKRYGRRVIKYFASPKSIDKYDKAATSKSAFVFISIGFLFPFIPDPILGYIAGTTPISTRVLMIICIIMRTPGVLMTALVGSQFGQGNYWTVTALLVGLAIFLTFGVIYYKQISDWADKLYSIAIRDSHRSLVSHEDKSTVAENIKSAKSPKDK